MIPKHSTVLQFKEYLPYLRNVFASSGANEGLLQEVWQERFPDRYLIPTPTGRHALWYFLNLVQLAPGSEVLIQSYNYFVVVRLLIQMGLKPVFVDIEPDSLGMDVNDLKRKIGPQTKLILLTHMFGNPADLDTFSAVAKENDLLLFEDCAHAVGTLYQGKQVGNWGDGALFSFGMMKSLSSFGGGMLVLDPELSSHFTYPERNLKFGTYFFGTFSRFVFSIMLNPSIYGWTHYPLTQCATYLSGRGFPLLKKWLSTSKNAADYRFSVNDRSPFKPFMPRMHSTQLERLEADNKKRRHTVQIVTEQLEDLEQVKGAYPDKYGRSNCSYFGLFVEEKEALSRYLKQYGVDNQPNEYFDCASLEQFAAFKADCPNSRKATDHLIRLPSYPGLSPSQVEKIATSIRNFYKG